MTAQLSITARNARLSAIATAIGASGILKIFPGAMPANCAAADAGTQLASPALPAAPFAAPANGVMSMSGTWEDTSADAAGTAGYFRLEDSSGACHLQGTCGAQVMVPTTAATAVDGNVLTVGSTSGISVGLNVSGTGIPTGTTVLATTSTTVTLSNSSIAGVANGATITFAPDMTLDNGVFAAGQDFKVTSFSLTDANA